MVKIESENEATARIESALYSSGRPLSVEELIKASGTESRPRTLAILDSLIKKTKNVFAAIEIVVLPDGNFVFQLKPEYSSSVRKYASKPIFSSFSSIPSSISSTKIFKDFLDMLILTSMMIYWFRIKIKVLRQ